MQTHSKKSKITLAIQASLIGLSFQAPLNAAIIEVESVGDNSLSDCTLREALTSINAGRGIGGCSNSSLNDFGVEDSVVFSNNLASNTIVLANGDIIIGQDVSIEGNANNIVIDAVNQSRIFTIDDSLVSIDRLTLRNGNATEAPYVGGAIDAIGSTLTVTDSVLSNNTAQSGGAISLRSSSLVLTNSELSSNSATEYGGGISLAANISGGSEATITGGTFSDNTAGGYGGGAINAYYYASLSITGSTFNRNIATGSVVGGNGGALRSVASKATIADSVFTANSATSRGGAINADSGNYSYNALDISGTTLSNNSSSQGGALRIRLENVAVTLDDMTINDNSAAFAAAMFASDSDIAITDSEVFDNSASNFAGALQFSDTTASIERSSIYGNLASRAGAILLSSGSTLDLTASTINANSVTEVAGGLSLGLGTSANIINSTISGNSATDTGGGINSGFATLTLTNTTLADNSAATAAGLNNDNSNITIANSILANSSTGSDCAGTAVVSDTQSIIEQDDCLSGARAIDPGLLPLADNGGATKTHALTTNSEALNSGDNASCEALDQREKPRSDGSCDVGAFELQPDDDVDPETDDTSFIVIPLPSGKAVVIPN